MRSGPAFRSSIIVFTAGWAFGLGCLLNSNAFDSAGAGATTTSTTTAAGGSTTTTTPSTGGTTTTTTTTTDGGAGAGGMMTTGGSAGAGAGGSGGSTTTSTTTTTSTGPTTPVSCSDAKTQGTKASGKVTIDPDGDGPNAPFDVYCDMDFEKDYGWALLYNSIGDMLGQTTDFWNIKYSDRLSVKGVPDLKANYYNGSLYKLGLYFRDDVEDTTGKVFLLSEAQVKSPEGFDETTMKFQNPKQVGGNADFYGRHFGGWWSSWDYDGDGNGNSLDNCALYDIAKAQNGVSQHYLGCWAYSLGVEFASPFIDSGWGPHIYNDFALKDPILKAIAMDNQKQSSRVNRISRFVRW